MQQVIFITGVSSGFGQVTANLLAEKGYIVYGTSRKEQESNKMTILQMDVRDPKSIEKAVDHIIKKEGRIDVLINNAGVGIGGAIELATEEEIQLQMSTNFMGTVHVCKYVLPVFRAQKSGRIINISSIGGIMGLPYQGYYSASKFAIEGYSEALAAEVKGFGIRVSIIEPGDFVTHFTSCRKNSEHTQSHPDYKDSFARSLRLIEKEENAGLQPIILAKKIESIICSKKPKFRYVVANFEQKFSIFVKRIVPGNMFVDILRSFYKV